MKPIQAVPRGRYTPLRIVQTALAGLIFLCMVGSMISGIFEVSSIFESIIGSVETTKPAQNE